MYNLIDLPKISRSGFGDLTFIEGQNHIPFEIKRVYYIYNTGDCEQRGRHAYRTIQSLIVALYGKFDITLDDGHDRVQIKLNSPERGLYVPAMTWKELDNFSAGAVCLVLVSDLYREDDYIRDYGVFIREARLRRR